MALLVPVLYGCAINVTTDPDTFSLGPAWPHRWRHTQPISLVNEYKGESKVTIRESGKGPWVFDQQQMTDTAIIMLSRAITKNGGTARPQAEKVVTLAVRVMHARTYLGGNGIVRVAVDVQFGNVETSISGEYLHKPLLAFNPGKAATGAMHNALLRLISDPRFDEYVRE